MISNQSLRQMVAAIAAIAASLSITGCGGGTGTAGSISLLAGRIGGPGNLDGAGAAARFNLPLAVVVAPDTGHVYVADSSNGRIREVTPDGVVTTLAGSSYPAPTADGTGTQAVFGWLAGMAMDPAGNMVVLDGRPPTSGGSFRQVSREGVVTTLSSLDQFWRDRPGGVAFDAAGNLYVTGGTLVRKIMVDGSATILAGSTVADSADGQGSAARFDGAGPLAVNAGGNVYVADRRNHLIRKIDPSGQVSTLAGAAGQAGTADGRGPEARFLGLTGIAVDRAGMVYVTDLNRVRKVDPGGLVTTVAGSGEFNSGDGTGAQASFAYALGIAVDSVGSLYVVSADHTLRKISPSGVVTTVAGLATLTGYVDGPGPQARFGFANGGGLATDSAGNVYVADTLNHAVRKIDANGLTTTLAGREASGTPNAPAIPAFLYEPRAVAVDALGNVYVLDATSRLEIRKIARDGSVTTIAGDTIPWGAPYVQSLAVDRSGNVYIVSSATLCTANAATAGEQRIRCAALTGAVTGAPDLPDPVSVAIGPDGNLVATANTTFRDLVKITPTAVATVIPGTASTQLARRGLAVDESGAIYVCEGNLVVKLGPAGERSIVAGAEARMGIAMGDLPGSLEAPISLAFMGPRTLAVLTSGAVLKIALR